MEKRDFFFNLRGKLTHTVPARQLVHAEMATNGVRHTFAVILDTCFHEKEGVNSINK